jgi:PAS domain S-box-containing protein
MISAVVGQAEGIDTLEVVRDAVKQCQSQLAGQQPQAGVVFASGYLDHALMLEEIEAHFPGLDLVGCTTDGEISSGLGHSDDSICLMLFNSSQIQFKALLVEDLWQNPQAALEQACRQAWREMGREPSLCLAFPDGHGKDADGLLEMLTAELGRDCPVFGGAAGTLWVENFSIKVFYKTRVLQDAMPLLFMAGPLKYSFAIGHGWEPIGKRAVVSEAEGATVKRIGDMKAVEFYRHYLGEHFVSAREFVLAVYEQGKENYYVRAPLDYLEDESIVFSGKVPEGAQVQLTEPVRDSLLQQASRTAGRAASASRGWTPAFALAFSCGFRKEVLGTRSIEEVARIKEALPPGLPLAGFFSFGEIAPLDYGGLGRLNGTVIVTLLVGPGQEIASAAALTAQKSPAEADADGKAEDLKRQIRYLQRRLNRSEKQRSHLEGLHDFTANLHRKIILEVEEARAEIQRKEAALRRSEEKYRRIIETTGNGFILMDQRMRIIDVNQAYCQMLGYEPGQIVGKQVFELASEDFRSFMLANRDEILARDYRKLEGDLMTRKGRRVPVLIHGNTLRDGQGNIIGNVAFVTDMTEHKKALQLAAEVQMSLLPQGRPDVRGLDVAGRSLPCDEIGGDYFDYLWLPGSQGGPFSAVVGDITGHGVDAALLMTTARAFLKMRAAQPGKINDILNDLNRHLARDVSGTGKVMTMFFLTLDPAEMKLHWVRAGHDPAIVYDASKDAFGELRGAGIPLGLDGGFSYEQNSFGGLHSGQVIALGTDGIWEAVNKDGMMYGKERLKEVLRKNAQGSASQMLDAVYKDLADFTYGLPPEDDVTLVIIKMQGA